jgi:hypothetical protein
MFVKTGGNFLPGGRRANTADTKKFCSRLTFFKYKKFIVIRQIKPNIHLNRLNLGRERKPFFSLSTRKFNDYRLK